MSSLREKLQPVYPVQFEILDIIDAELAVTDNDEYKKILLKLSKERMLKYSDFYITDLVAFENEFLPVKAYSTTLYQSIVDTLRKQKSYESHLPKYSDYERGDIRRKMLDLAIRNDECLFMNFLSSVTTKDLLLVVKELIRTGQIDFLKDRINTFIGCARLKRMILSELSLQHTDFILVVGRLLDENCKLSQHCFVFLKYFYDAESWLNFLKIAKVYFSLLDYSPQTSLFSLFSGRKNPYLAAVARHIEVTLLSTQTIDLVEFYQSLQHDLLKAYDYGKDKLDAEDTLRYQTSVIKYNFG